MCSLGKYTDQENMCLISSVVVLLQRFKRAVQSDSLTSAYVCTTGIEYHGYCVTPRVQEDGVLLERIICISVLLKCWQLG